MPSWIKTERIDAASRYCFDSLSFFSRVRPRPARWSEVQIDYDNASIRDSFEARSRLTREDIVVNETGVLFERRQQNRKMGKKATHHAEDTHKQDDVATKEEGISDL